MEPQSSAIVEPGLNPNQPNHNTNTPMVAEVRLWPGIGLTWPALLYLPIRGPSIHAPVSAAQPPIECTTVDPAKSSMPIFASQPPPQIQCPPIGYMIPTIKKENRKKAP